MNGTHIDGYLYRTGGGPIYKFCGMDGSCTNIYREQFTADASVGQKTFKVGESFIPAKDYRVHLSLSAEGDKEVAKDDSDAAFSIVEPPNPPLPFFRRTEGRRGRLEKRIPYSGFPEI